MIIFSLLAGLYVHSAVNPRWREVRTTYQTYSNAQGQVAYTYRGQEKSIIDSVPYDGRMTPENVTFLYHDMPCRMCLGNCIHPFEDGRYPCIARLPAEDVLAAVTRILDPAS